MYGNIDRYNRKICYLRVSITDRCNFRCRYCMPNHGVDQFDHSEIMTYEEITRVVQAAAKIGIRKIRLTGGEPLVRRNVVHLVRNIVNVPGIEDVGLTTNGALLGETAASLFHAGLRRVNISLDTLNPLKFFKITRRNRYQDVIAGISEAQTLGFAPIKINVVLMRGVNDDELESFARLSIEKPYAVRFIEYMPIGRENTWTSATYMSVSEIQRRLEAFAPLHPISSSSLDGPSQRFQFSSAKGEIGLISAVSNHFCGTCNRMRLTPDGKLRSCLFSDEETDLKTALRAGCTEADIIAMLYEAIIHKPRGHHLNDKNESQCLRNMSKIGG